MWKFARISTMTMAVQAMHNFKVATLTVIGALLCIVPPAAVTMAYFPLWVQKSATSTLSGLSMILILVSIIPLFKLIKDHLKTPSAPILWGIICISAVMFRSIIDQIVVIAFVGTISSIAGFFIFKARDRIAKENNHSQKE